MTSPHDSGSSTDPASSEPPSDAGQEELQADIEQTRAELGDTVEALAHKLDVKAQAEEQVQVVKDNANAQVAAAQTWVAENAARAKDAATDDEGKPTPQVIAIAAAAVLLVAVVVLGSAKRKKLAKQGNKALAKTDTALAKRHAKEAERRARQAVGHSLR